MSRFVGAGPESVFSDCLTDASVCDEQSVLHILVITALYPPHHLGGYELRCKEVVERLRARGHQVRVLTSTYGAGRRTMDGDTARVLHLEPSRALLQRVVWDTLDLRFIRAVIRSYRPDVIHLWHMAELARTIFPFLARLSLPIVYDEGGFGLILAWSNHGRWLGFCEGQSKSRAKAVVKRVLCRFISALTGDLLPRKWAWPSQMTLYFNSHYGPERARAAGVPVEKNPRVIYSGINLGLWAYRPRESLGSPLRLVAPGRVTEIKGIHDAIMALARVETLVPGYPFHLRVVGPLVDPTYHARLVKLTQDLDLANHVSFEGPVAANRMPIMYREADICLFPSRQMEGLSRVPLEAMASGAVVITAGNEGSAEYIRNGETGFLVNGSNPEETAGVIKMLYDNPDLYARVARRARQEVEEHFTLDRAVDQIEMVLRSAVQCAGAPSPQRHSGP